MIALDTNLLIYAHRSSTPEHRGAQRAIETALASPRGCGLPAPAVAEFWRIVTDPASAARPSQPAEARRFLAALVEEAGLEVWLPSPGFAPRLAAVAETLGLRGSRILDLQIALTAFDNGATEIWTHDRAFVAVPGMRVVDPL